MNTEGKVIGIYSSCPRQGKSTIRERLVSAHGFRHLPFARIVKKMTYAFLIEHGYRDEEVVRYIETAKEVPLERVAGMPTTRYLTQTLGTDWGRHMVHSQVWLMEWEAKARVWSRSGINVVADDLRFPNEFQVIRGLGGMVWRVERPDVQPSESSVHESEGGLNGLPFDRVISNNSNLLDLDKKVDAAVKFTRTGVLEV